MKKKDYTVYKARLQYHEFNEFIDIVMAYTVDAVKKHLQARNINPFYTVIIDTSNGAQIIEHNKHLNFVTK